MKDRLCWFGIFLTLLGGLVVAIWIYIDYQDWKQQPRAIKSLFQQASREDLRRAHHYHGIQYSFQEEGGRWFFMRDEKRCGLFAYRNKEVE